MFFVQLRIAKVKTTFCLCENSTSVETAALLLHDPDDKGVGLCLHCKILAETFVPGKCFVHSFRILTDAFLVVEVKGGRGTAPECFLTARWSQRVLFS